MNEQKEIFGPEDGTLGERVLSWCRDVVYVPTDRCMNLAATVNVILYDRAAKMTSPNAVVTGSGAQAQQD